MAFQLEPGLDPYPSDYFQETLMWSDGILVGQSSMVQRGEAES